MTDDREFKQQLPPSPFSSFSVSLFSQIHRDNRYWSKLKPKPRSWRKEIDTKEEEKDDVDDDEGHDDGDDNDVDDDDDNYDNANNDDENS